MKKLLIPTDFSETSDAALDFGLQLAKKFGYEVILFHSVEFVNTFESMYIDALNVHSFSKEVVNDCEARLQDMMRQCDMDASKLSTRLKVGDLISDIKEVVKEEKVDLIIMGTKGASGLKEFIVGSNTEKVVRLIDCPVISIPKTSQVRKIRKISVPVDPRELRPGFLQQISILQQLFSAAIEFVWVKTPHSKGNSDLISKEFNNALCEFEIASSSFTIIQNVSPVDGILSYVRKNKTDMLAMATHAHRGLTHLTSGSLTEDVMNHLEIPMWSFKMDENENRLILKEKDGFHVLN